MLKQDLHASLGRTVDFPCAGSRRVGIKRSVDVFAALPGSSISVLRENHTPRSWVTKALRPVARKLLL
ncbi:hypothetical protein KCP78_05945 [Salmonella enterica subsp. enterica]|nr:hypothetical protein KCP78_05945 [Salmonella enterica subsp. enterica]